MLISLDTETTGIDIAHGAMPFLVTTCCNEGEIRFWEWDVDPLTRRPIIPDGDIPDIIELIDAADLIYLQNAKFDYRALLTIGVELPWTKVRDTLVMGHLLASNHPHDLTSMCIEYLGQDIEHYEIEVNKVTRACRIIVGRDYPEWRIAGEGLADMPSVKASTNRDDDKPWKNDMWLPRALAAQWYTENRPLEDARWLTCCQRYANADSEHTLPLGIEMERIIRQRGLWKIYESRLHLPRIACEMELNGVTVIGEYTESTICQYAEYSAEAGAELVAIAADYGHTLELAEGASLNDNMRDFFYGAVNQSCPRCGYTKRVKHWQGESARGHEVCPKCQSRKRDPAVVTLQVSSHENLGLPIIWSPKTGNATLDKDAMKEYLGTLDGPAYDFVKLLEDKRKHDTDLTYMESYRRFWLPIAGVPDFYRIHPSLNPFGTDHLRWSSNSPNLQNVSKHDKGERLSVRNCFGPFALVREWWTMDFKSIEARIPAYESNEPKMVEIFEKPNDAPYWGNLYCLTASVLYPDEYWLLADVPHDTEGSFKWKYPLLYKQAKFFVLAKNYGCGRRKGDALSKVKNSFDLVDNEFPMLARLQAHYLNMAERLGYVETIPDREVDPKRGYPILASRTDDGRVLSTTPFNYHVSGTACWAKNKALLRCSAQCAEWRAEGFDAKMCLEIHDEILFDFPRGDGPQTNLARAERLRSLMERSGDDIGMPTPVSLSYHDVSWAKEVAV